MPIFRYMGYRNDGTPARGTVEAEGFQDALASVKSLGVHPKDVSEYVYEQKQGFFRRRGSAQLPAITRQLSTLLAAGVPLIEALRSLADEQEGYWKNLLVSVRDKVASGSGLSRALGSQGRIFPDFYIHMVAASEQSGNLDKVLVRVADYLEKQEAIRSRLRSAMVYPLFMTGVGFVVLAFLFIFVVPKIVGIFENTRNALPFITVVLIHISNFFVSFWWALCVAAAILFLLFRELRKKRRDLFDRIKLNFPGRPFQSLYYGRFAGSLGFLLEGGLPMLRALELSARATGNTVLESVIHKAARQVAEGGRLSSALEGFPPVLRQLISTGERSGTLTEVLKKASQAYEEEFDRRVQNALSLLEPLMILAMGIIVGFIVFAVLLPMFQLNQLIR